MTIVPSLGNLELHPDIDEWMISSPTAVPWLHGRLLRFVVVDLSNDDAPNDFEDAIASFLALGASELSRVGPHLYRNYERMLAALGVDEIGVSIEGPAEVWMHVAPQEIHVRRRWRRDRKVYVKVDAECGWDKEHGVQIIYRGGRELSRVSQQDGHCTYADARGLLDDLDRIDG